MVQCDGMDIPEHHHFCPKGDPDLRVKEVVAVVWSPFGPSRRRAPDRTLAWCDAEKYTVDLRAGKGLLAASQQRQYGSPLSKTAREAEPH
jgi:hypothetical protein